MMMMKKNKSKEDGNSDARNRQGEGTVPALPRSSVDLESRDGLSASLAASGANKLAIAGGSRMKEKPLTECKKERDILFEKKVF